MPRTLCGIALPDKASRQEALPRGSPLRAQPLEPFCLTPVGARGQCPLALARLVDIGAANWVAGGGVRWNELMSVSSSLEASAEKSTREQEVQSSRLEMMRRYAEHTGCRRSFLLTYFGQNYPGPCGNCDNDLQRPSNPHWEEPFPIGTRVATEHWGEGTIQRYDRDQVTILFDDHGYRDLLVPTLLEKKLIRPL